MLKCLVCLFVLDTSDAKALQILLMHVDGQAQSRTAGQLSNQKGPCRGCSVQALDIERIGASLQGELPRWRPAAKTQQWWEAAGSAGSPLLGPGTLHQQKQTPQGRLCGSADSSE